MTQHVQNDTGYDQVFPTLDPPVFIAAGESGDLPDDVELATGFTVVPAADAAAKAAALAAAAAQAEAEAKAAEEAAAAAAAAAQSNTPNDPPAAQSTAS